MHSHALIQRTITVTVYPTSSSLCNPPPLMYSETLLSLHQTFLLALSQACSSSNPCLGDIFQVILPQLQSYADFITLKRRHARRVCQWQGVHPFQLAIVLAVAYLDVH